LTQDQLLLLFVPVGAAVLALVGLTAFRPSIGVAALVLLGPLTAGLTHAGVPLRWSDILILLIAGGVLLHELPRRRGRPMSGLDLIIVSFVLASVLTPLLVLLVTHTEIDLERWREVLAPAQYLVYYLIFSRLDLPARGLRLILNLAMAASIIVGLVAIAEAADLPGVRDFVHTFFTPPPSLETLYRPTSLLEHFSGVGALAVLYFSLALSLATVRQPGFPGIWLALVMAINAGSLVASQTYAPMLGLAVAVACILWFGRRIPAALALPAAAMLVGLLIFLSPISTRLEQQFQSGSPESLTYRTNLWEEYFLPIFVDHIWFGTGTVVPSDVPERFTHFVDNEYLTQGFRAGIGGIILLLATLFTIGVAASRCRASPSPWPRAVGAATLASVLALALMSTTAEYLGFAGVSQQFWMMVGLLAAARHAPAPAPTARPAIAGTEIALKPA